MAQQWRKDGCALLTGALRKKLTRKCARVGFFPKEHQCAMTRKDRPKPNVGTAPERTIGTFAGGGQRYLVLTWRSYRLEYDITQKFAELSSMLGNSSKAKMLRHRM
jgi:hypothetical protein